MNKRTAINSAVRKAPHNIIVDAYWVAREYDLNWDELQQAVELSRRYLSYCDYCNEVLPEWKEVSHISWGDNSETSEQVCKCGKHKRSVPVTAPHGDICF